MAQACLGVLLRVDDEDSIQNFPLAQYAGDYFGEHAEFEGALSHILDGVDQLLDADKPHFAIWLCIHPDHPEQRDIIPMHYVSERGFRGLVEYLISKRPQDVSFNGKHGTPLHAAARGGHVDVAQLLIGHGVDVDARDSEEQTPLHLTAEYGFLDVARMLVEKDAKINARDRSDRTPLIRTMERWDQSPDIRADMAKILVEHGADVDAKDNEDSTALHHASFNGYAKAAIFLLESGANPSVRRKDSQTPLHRVLNQLTDTLFNLEGCLDTVRCLLGHEVDVDAQDSNLATSLHVASFWGCATAVQLLLKHGASVCLENDKGETPYQVALAEGNTRVALLLSDHVQSEQKMQ
jgi:ankyrin repeat protein